MRPRDDGKDALIQRIVRKYVTNEGGVAIPITVAARGCATADPYNMISATVGVAKLGQE